MNKSFPIVVAVSIAGFGACSGNHGNNDGTAGTGGLTSPRGGAGNSGGNTTTIGGASSGGASSGGASSGGASSGGASSGGASSGGASSGGASSGGALTTTGGLTSNAGGNGSTGASASTGGNGIGGQAVGGQAAGGASAIGGKATGGNATGGSTAGGKSAGGSGSGGVNKGGTAAIGGSLASGGSVGAGGVIAAGGTTAIGGPASFHCVNWADRRDNYVDGLLELSGLSSATDTYATVQSKANDILSEFQTKLKANSIRIPINEPTVSSTWWNAYKAVIDTAVAKGMKVVVAYWAYQNGKPDDAAAFKNMWQTVVAAYQSNNLVYFDIHNEPYGYAAAWNDAAAQWLTDFPGVPKGRVIVAGTGYDDTVTPVGSDSRFAGCILELHIYGFWHTGWTTQKQWSDSMTAALGSYSARTLVGEWGASMTGGTDYSVNTDGDAYRSYIRAASDIMHNNGMGSCYWPGLRDGDSYSMTTRNTSGSSLTLTVNSTSGLDRLHWAWQL